jgi:hypothetical protein
VLGRGQCDIGPCRFGDPIQHVAIHRRAQTCADLPLHLQSPRQAVAARLDLTSRAGSPRRLGSILMTFPRFTSYCVYVPWPGLDSKRHPPA